MSNYERGEVVWAKIIGFPWWPAIIISYIPQNHKNDKSNNVIVNFIGENTHAYLNEEKIRKFEENMEKFGKDIKNKKLKDSIVEAQRVALAGIPINFPKNIENKEISKNENILHKKDDSIKINKSIENKIKIDKKKLKLLKAREKRCNEKRKGVIILEKPNKKLLKSNINHSNSKRIKKTRTHKELVHFTAFDKKSLNQNTSSSFRSPPNNSSNENLPEKTLPLSFLQNEIDLKKILNDLMNLFSISNNSLSSEEKEIIIKNISDKLIETLELMDNTLKQEYNNLNRNSLLTLLKEGYGKYIGSITKIFEAHKPHLNEVFVNFNQKFSEIYDKIKHYFFHRYLSIDEKYLQQYKLDYKDKKNTEILKSKSFSLSEGENLNNFLEEESKTEENLMNFTDNSLEIKHFRKKFCVKIARILQMQYSYEKQKSHDITIKIEKKLRKEFPLMNSDYKTNGLLLLNLLKNNSMDIIKLIEELDQLDGKNACEIQGSDVLEEEMRDKRSKSL